MTRAMRIGAWLLRLLLQWSGHVAVHRVRAARGTVLLFAWPFPLLQLAILEDPGSLDPGSTGRHDAGQATDDEGPPTTRGEPGIRHEPPPGHPERVCRVPPSETELSLWRQISAGTVPEDGPPKP
ncbi:hypothetical protein I6A60_28965 [Frankia sp. AgB1.9]|uniref:DUF6059 family protein n=1 Tax=unclassified Frankia TaxID=2632575 RepID=UPI001934A36B|nr:MULTISPECIES: DUF6059 family protein [unclassified Frankia]MBL7492312.1 hypothetical protein [Frankia sp. AgW1.1]MBL7551861.1 hypothetical protein [Frankia sp. AgB1.9]MBL7625558.1 hypothetical protein [Frankia sp. AgB1.8]